MSALIKAMQLTGPVLLSSPFLTCFFLLFSTLFLSPLSPSPPLPPLSYSLQEIDGKALMLLRSDVIMKYMGLKLGPALKLCHHIEKLKQAKP